MKKYFISSDVHGHYTQWRKALNRAGFKSNNPDHIVIHIGDLFDRGQESYACYQFARRLEKMNQGIFIMGNHTEFLIKFLEKRESLFNYIHNGFQATVDDFLHRTEAFASWLTVDKNISGDITEEMYNEWAKEAADEINKELPELLNWLKTRPYYYETKNNIFSHGAIDTKTADWRQPTLYYRNMFGWKACTWVGPDFFVGWMNRTGKTCNFGHLDADLLRSYLHIDEENIGSQNILYWRQQDTYFMDSCSILTGKVNVRVIEDE